VLASQLEAGRPMLGKRKCGRLISLEIVAAIAGIEIRRRGKLAGMQIAVTVGAALELDLEQGVLPFRDMTLGTMHRRVFSLQRVSRGGVFLAREFGRLPAVHGMTGSALAAFSALAELSAVRARLVAVHALLKNQRLLEVAAAVALQTVDTHVFAKQRKFSPGVVEALIERLHRDLFPPAGVVAGLASLHETAAMRIVVAVSTLRKSDSRVPRLVVGARGVALLAGDLRMQTRQRIAGPGVVELSDADRFPTLEVVTLNAIRPQPSLVLVLVASGACGRNSQECPVRVLDPD